MHVYIYEHISVYSYFLNDFISTYNSRCFYNFLIILICVLYYIYLLLSDLYLYVPEKLCSVYLLDETVVFNILWLIKNTL